MWMPLTLRDSIYSQRRGKGFAKPIKAAFVNQIETQCGALRTPNVFIYAMAVASRGAHGSIVPAVEILHRKMVAKARARARMVEAKAGERKAGRSNGGSDEGMIPKICQKGAFRPRVQMKLLVSRNLG